MSLWHKLVMTVEALTTWGYFPTGDLPSADCICGQAFGYQGPKKASEELRIPGPCNEQIGRVVRDLKEKLDIPASLQGEIKNSAALQNRPIEQVIFHNPEPGKYVSCYTIESLTWQWMKENGWNRVILVTHPLLIWRMKKVLEKLAANDDMQVDVIVPVGLEDIGWDPYRHTVESLEPSVLDCI